MHVNSRIVGLKRTTDQSHFGWLEGPRGWEFSRVAPRTKPGPKYLYNSMQGGWYIISHLGTPRPKFPCENIEISLYVDFRWHLTSRQ